MKKGIVMEMRRRYMIVMRRDGAFQKARRIPEAAVGMEVHFQPFDEKRPSVWHSFVGERTRIPFRITAMACALLLLLLPVYFMMQEEEVYAYVNVAINPNMELEIDDKLKVHSIKPQNDDAEVFLEQLKDYSGKGLEEVLQIIMQETERADMLKNGKSMLVGISYIPETHNVRDR